MLTLVSRNSPAAPSGNRRRRSIEGGWKQITINRAFLLPAVVVFVFLFIIPLAQGFYWSLTDFTGYNPEANFIGMANYAEILRDPSMLSALAFTVLFAVGTTVIVTCLAIPLAVQLNKVFLGRNFVRSLWFFPAVPSMAILGLVWSYILSPLPSGVLNTTLNNWFGIDAVSWLSDNSLARMSVILVGVWAQVGWHAVLYVAYLQAIPTEYYEVAKIDGASARQQFFSITLPLLTPAMVISSFLLLTGGLKVFELPYTLTNGGPGFATNTITQALITSGVSQGRYGLASALAVMFTIVVAIVGFSQLKVTTMISRRFS
ncbi:carbohydrate ABC transporter permease [Arthrobacter sp. RIT-PI-e]|uniref:carbohydrate ABC transporter permease n=1 Tax=Arthrobacter sp. RIT-PI-e TaxID=1681197 RepID=UPI0009E41057|nr:sugar ABC transporter permease [Arthrobacter sp. RIT-PI-e]